MDKHQLLTDIARAQNVGDNATVKSLQSEYDRLFRKGSAVIAPPAPVEPKRITLPLIVVPMRVKQEAPKVAPAPKVTKPEPAPVERRRTEAERPTVGTVKAKRSLYSDEEMGWLG